MFNSWRIGRVAGIDLFLHPTFLLLMLVAYLMGGGLLGVLFLGALFGCVLLHELGHALTARWYNIRTHDITLSPIGGVARLERMPRKAGPELLITLAGPATNLAIAGVLGLVLAASRLVIPTGALSQPEAFLQSLLLVNLVLAAFNLIPAFPMDGGRILRATLSGPMGRLGATEVAATVGQTLALVLPLVLLWLGSLSILHVVLAAFVFWAAGIERAQVRAEEAGPARVDSRMDRRGEPDGFWVAPPGYDWSSRGDGSWRAVPLTVPLPVAGRHRRTPRREPSTWRLG